MTGAGALLAACDRAVLYGVVHVPLYSYAAPGYKMPLGAIALLAARASAHSFAPRVTLFAGGSAYVPYGTCPRLTVSPATAKPGNSQFAADSPIAARRLLGLISHSLGAALAASGTAGARFAPSQGSSCPLAL